MAAKATRTVNPLHFEDLEPHRFEDMVRQLAYDYRPWKSIEATGRLGSDEGMDVRAMERFAEGASEGDADEAADVAEEEAIAERMWIIQCKREKSIGPTRMKTIVGEVLSENGPVPYGFIIAAACDFSKQTRDVFHTQTRARGVSEGHLWGKAELEDMLFLPKNDYLLFAYFSISLQVRRRSLRTELRSRIAMKRKLTSVLGGVDKRQNKIVLVRDPREDHYPRQSEIPDFKAFPRWRYYRFVGHRPPDHLTFVVRKHFAYLDDDAKKWDAILQFNDEEAIPPQLMGSVRRLDQGRWEKRARYHAFWHKKIPEKNRATLEVLRFIHYDRILAVDDDGDSSNPGPHLLVEFNPEHGPFEPWQREIVEVGLGSFRKQVLATPETRMPFFPKMIPEPNQAAESTGEAKAEQ